LRIRTVIAACLRYGNAPATALRHDFATPAGKRPFRASPIVVFCAAEDPMPKPLARLAATLALALPLPALALDPAALPAPR